MTNNLVYEITQKMTDGKTLQKDMGEAAELVQNLFKDRYINKMSEVLNTHKQTAENNPPKEVQLLNVIKSFLPEEKHDTLNRLSEIVLLMTTFQNIQSDLHEVSVQNVAESYTGNQYLKKDTSIHEDGIYEIDAECVSAPKEKSNNLIPLFFMMAILGKGK